MQFFTSATLPPGIPPERILGIEVTDEPTRARCGAGNAVGAGRRPVVAFDSIGDHVLTIDTVVTTTPTLNTIGAMSRLLLRRLDLWPAFSGDDTDYPPAEQRCDDIARATLWTPPRTWTPRPLPTLDAPWGPETLEPIEGRRFFAHVAAIADGRTGLDLATRVAIIACWLLWGDSAPESSVDRAAAHRIHNECGIVRCRQIIFCEEAQRALTLARTMVDAARAQLVADAWAGALELHHGVMTSYSRAGLAVAHQVQTGGGSGLLAVTRSAQPGAMALAHHVAPVVIHFGARGAVEISAWPEGCFVDCDRLYDALHLGDPSAIWTSNSPCYLVTHLHRGSLLPEADIIAAVRRCLQ